MTLLWTIRLIIFTLCLKILSGQYGADTPLYEELMSAAVASLEEDVSSLPDTVNRFHPEKLLLYADNYRTDFPLTENFRIGIIINPCPPPLPYNCCTNVFGTPEYPSLILTGEEAARVVKTIVIGSPSEVAVNYELVYEDGTPVPATSRRWADDEAVLDPECEARNVPYTYCMGKQYAFQRSSQYPACTDNNQTVNTLAGCTYPNGTRGDKCLQVGYTQTVFSALCQGDDPHCGTFLEVHQTTNLYQPLSQVISEVRIDTRNVSGYYTTVLPMTYMKNQSRVLCAYTESRLRIGSLVYIKAGAVCCCPKPYNPNTRVGSSFCPIGPTGRGPFAIHYRKLQDYLDVDALQSSYPFCLSTLSEGDRLVCSVTENHDMRNYVRNCTEVEKRNALDPRSFTSIDLDGLYDGVCPYFSNCALTLNFGQCKTSDLLFSFVGYVGLVTQLDNSAAIPQVWVTFNAGRTSYQFAQENVQLETRKSMYEIWWVVRTRTEYVIQKVKGFNVTSPECSFDIPNSRYFPYREV